MFLGLAAAGALTPGTGMADNDVASAIAVSPATVSFTATDLRRGYGGVSVGRGTVSVYAGSRACDNPQVVEARAVTADHPVARFRLPPERELLVTSAWSAGFRRRCSRSSPSSTSP